RVAARRLSGEAPASVRLPSGSLDHASSAGQALLVIGRSALRQMLGNLELVANGAVPEAIHQFRVGLRRLRAALALFKSCLDPDQRQALSAELRWTNAIFADARDWDVFTAETLAPMADALTDGASLAPAMAAA